MGEEDWQMNSNLIRGSLFGGGAGLVLYAFPGAFITDWFWLLLIVGAAMIIAGGLLERDDTGGDYRVVEHHDDQQPVWQSELDGD